MASNGKTFTNSTYPAVNFSGMNLNCGIDGTTCSYPYWDKVYPAADFNRDGKVDFIVTQFETNSTSTFAVLSQVNGYVKQNQELPELNWVALSDYNGDGLVDIARQDIFTSSSTSAHGEIFNTVTGVPPDLLLTFKSPLGSKLTLTYQPLTCTP